MDKKRPNTIRTTIALCAAVLENLAEELRLGDPDN